MGQSNIWYADSANEKVANFRLSVIHYIDNYVKPERRKTKPNIDVDAKVAVEKAAISAVTSYYKGSDIKYIRLRAKTKVGIWKHIKERLY